jgi:hypothetical protein
MNNKTGLTDKEQVIMDHLVAAFNEFSLCEKQHPDEYREFTDSIHRLQDILAVRVIRRVYPEGWPTYIKGQK